MLSSAQFFILQFFDTRCWLKIVRIIWGIPRWINVDHNWVYHDTFFKLCFSAAFQGKHSQNMLEATNAYTKNHK